MVPDGSCYDYGSRVLYSPRNKSDLKKYGKFSEELALSCEQTFLFGPFDFMPKDSSTPAQAIIHDSTWLRLNEICEARSILPPTVGQDSDKTAANVVLLRSKLGDSNFPSSGAFSSLTFVRRILENIAPN